MSKKKKKQKAQAEASTTAQRRKALLKFGGEPNLKALASDGSLLAKLILEGSQVRVVPLTGHRRLRILLQLADKGPAALRDQAHS